MKFRFRSARFKSGFVAALAVAAGCAVGAPSGKDDSPGAPNAGAGEPTWCVSIEPRFMRPPVAKPLSGAKSTILAACGLDSATGEIHYLKREELGPTAWEEFASKTQPAATAELARLTPEYLRDKNNVIECAVLHSDRQTTCGALLAPDFLKRFENVFGSKLLIAVPNRFTLYIFPALASRYAEYGNRVVSDYHATSYPVSCEVFELSASGLRAVGLFE